MELPPFTIDDNQRCSWGPLIPCYATDPSTGICSCKAGAECHSPGKHPTVSGWASDTYEQPPDLDLDHVALRCDFLAVIDCDTPKAAEQWLKHEPSAASTPQVRTGRGRHFYYARPENAPGELHSANGIADDTDIKTGSGSYVMAPGSLHQSGARYEWVGDGD